MTLQTNQPITSQELADSVRYGVAEQDRILRKKEVAKIFSVSSSTLDDWLNPKSKRYKADFPKRIEIGRKAHADHLNQASKKHYGIVGRKSKGTGL